ncbi:glycerol-3-phosphate acyltransferase plsy [Trichococcus palustris]|uniref:Glycerol-3-phosphate acyltransferase n=1 Tax=Trichococcus palustris TaxID=140314 RepID=A0A143YEM6_9LACT|nr:glycerol-3-phosphate 1-O-acyltransferase PlsY [Trichococcus palustris]CZQ85091.1 glycerol-3-phosphate acyltransferase plsy [Trichococcus palustris]SFK54918.1 glycerol-3-phosphate acyltransferase PlsY [Trichococcus palustris]
MTAIVIILAYLLGSIPSGIWIGKYFYHTDIRKLGSGNSGTTNTYRVLGKKAGTVVLIMDILKGSIATLLPLWFGLSIHPLLIGVIAAIGHTYPIFAGFKGGKAVATSAGIILAYNPPFFMIAIVFFLVYLYFSRMVSLSSILACLTAIVVSFSFHDWALTTVTVFLTIFITYRHRSNIERIKNGTESKVPFGYRAKESK